MAQEVRSHIVVQAAADMERPQVLESQVLVPGLDDAVSQVFVNAFVAAVSQYSARLEGVPAIRISQVTDQFGARQPFQVNIPCGLRALRLDLVNPPVGAVPLGVRIGVSGPLVMEIADVHRAIGAERQIRRREPRVVGVEQRPHLPGFERRAARLHSPPGSGVSQEVGSDKTLMERLRKNIGIVDRAAHNEMAAGDAAVLDMPEESVGMEVVQRTVLAEALAVIAALYRMPEQGSAVRAVEEVPLAVEGQPVDVPSPFREQLELLGERMVAPDALLELDPANVAGAGAAVEAVEPPVRPPGEVICDRLRILHPETLEQDLGIGVR